MPRRARPSVAVFFALLLIEGSAVATAQRPSEQPPVLTAFSINGGADSILTSEPTIALTHTIVGTRPSEYRVSHRADFAGARWEPYAGTISMRDWYDASGPSCDSGRPARRVTFFLQVRTTLGEEVRVVDGQRQLVPARVESNVLRASVCARSPAKTSGSPERSTSPPGVP